MSAAPPWIDTEPDERDDTSRWAAMTPDERLEHFVQACELAAAMLRERPDVDAILSRRTPLAPESEARRRALVASAWAARSSDVG